MRKWRRQRKTNCPLCNTKLVKDSGKLKCPMCRIEINGDSCKFLDLPQMILGRYDGRKG
jgi:hypothetical protein